MTIRDVPDYWVRRDIEFESSASTATIKLSADNIPDSMAFFDNVTVTKIPLNNVTIYEAESAQIIGAEVLSANSASGGRFVGTIDDSNSSVQFLVNVPETAEYCMEIYYANGGNYTSSDNNAQYWGIWPGTSGVNSDASYYEAGGIDDSQRLTHCKATNYEVFTGQTLHEIQNGVYTLTAWVKGSGNNKHFVSIKNHGGEEIKQYIPETDSWEKVIIRNIPVTTNTCEIGLYSNASAYEWCSIDNITMQKTDTYVLPTDNPFDINLVTNPSFENDGAGTINGWGTWNGRDESGVSASFIENSGYDGAYRLTHYKNTDYEVFNGQTISNLIPGRYTLSAWVLGDDSTSHFLSIKNHGHPEQTVAIPNAPYPNWVEISIGDIDIYTGSCEIGVYSNASAGSWCSIDNVQLMLIDAY